MEDKEQDQADLQAYYPRHHVPYTELYPTLGQQIQHSP